MIKIMHSKHNYIDKWTCIAMMNKNCSLIESDDGLLAFKKTKDGSKVAAFSLDFKFDPSMHKHVSWLYLDEEPDKRLFDSVYSLEEIVSDVDCSKMFWSGDKRPAQVLAGKDNVEWRGTVNKWRKAEKEGRFEVEPLSLSNLESTTGMIERWRWLRNGGMKYGWQERAGCDKALVKRYVEDYERIKSHVMGNVFKLDNEVVGYSCIEKVSSYSIDGKPEFKYLTRKVLSIEGRRNLTEYIDYKTIELVHSLNPHFEHVLVNWGASSGGVHWYKSHKFPLYSIEKKWFCSKKAGKEKQRKGS